MDIVCSPNYGGFCYHHIMGGTVRLYIDIIDCHKILNSYCKFGLVLVEVLSIQLSTTMLIAPSLMIIELSSGFL